MSGLSGAAAGDDGVYLATLQVGSSSPGVVSSEAIYFVMHKNVGEDLAVQAAASLGFAPDFVQIVPEPASALLILGGALAVVRGRRPRG